MTIILQKRSILAALVVLLAAGWGAAFDDFGIEYIGGAQWAPRTDLTLGMEAALVTENNGTSFDRIKLTPTVEYQLLPWVETQLAFRWVLDEKRRSNKGDYWRDYWQIRYDVTPEWRLGKFSFSWRTRAVWENRGWLSVPEDVKSSTLITSSTEWRNRIQLLWRSPLWKLRPYLNSEIRIAWDDDPIDPSPRLSAIYIGAGVKKKWSRWLSGDYSLLWEREKEKGRLESALVFKVEQSVRF